MKSVREVLAAFIYAIMSDKGTDREIIDQALNAIAEIVERTEKDCIAEHEKCCYEMAISDIAKKIRGE